MNVARKSSVVLSAALAVLLLAQAWPGNAAPRLVVGAGVFRMGGRVSTLEMVGLNPQPEPPSRPTAVLHTSGLSVVSIRITCAARPAPRVYLATGKGSDGRSYAIRIEDRGIAVPGTDTRADVVGLRAFAYPPNPCADPGVALPVLVGDFIVR